MAITITQELAQKIVESVKDVCTYDVNFINPQGIIFASTNEKRIGNFHEAGRDSAKRQQTIEVIEDDNFLGTQKGVNIPFIYKGELCAVIGISGEPDKVRKYAYLAQKITSLLLREQELDRQEHLQKTQLGQVIRSIIHKEPSNPGYLTEFLKKYHIDPDTEYRTILVKLNRNYNPADFSLIENSIHQSFAQTGSSLFTGDYSNEYILLLESARLEQCLPVFEQLSQRYAPLLQTGIGASFPLMQQHNSYRSAQIALKSLFNQESLAVYDSLDLELLLSSVPQDIRTTFLKKAITQLSDKDRTLLETYFSCDMSLKQTCEMLYLHKNTLQYRLDKIRDTTGYNPRRFRDAVVLYMALRLNG